MVRRDSRAAATARISDVRAAPSWRPASRCRVPRHEIAQTPLLHGRSQSRSAVVRPREGVGVDSAPVFPNSCLVRRRHLVPDRRRRERSGANRVCTRSDRRHARHRVGLPIDRTSASAGFHDCLDPATDDPHWNSVVAAARTPGIDRRGRGCGHTGCAGPLPRVRSGRTAAPGSADVSILRPTRCTTRVLVNNRPSGCRTARVRSVVAMQTASSVRRCAPLDVAFLRGWIM